MRIDWWTLSLQAINFLVLVWLLWRFLFRPVKDVLARRREVAEAAAGKLDESRKEVEEEKRHYEQARRALADEHRALEKEMHAELAQERERVLGQAREEAGKIVESARSRLEEERESTLESLRGEVAELAAGMAAHLLGQASPQAYNELMLARIGERLEHLSDDERRQLEADLSAGDAVIRIRTGVELDDASRLQWSQRLRELLNSSAAIEFATDDSLIAGAALELPHAVIEFSWADQLEAAKAGLGPQ